MLLYFLYLVPLNSATGFISPTLFTVLVSVCRRMASFLSGGVMPPPSQQDVMESAGRLLDKHLQDDRNYLDMSDQLKVPIHSKIIISFRIQSASYNYHP